MRVSFLLQNCWRKHDLPWCNNLIGIISVSLVAGRNGICCSRRNLPFFINGQMYNLATERAGVEIYMIKGNRMLYATDEGNKRGAVVNKLEISPDLRFPSLTKLQLLNTGISHRCRRSVFEPSFQLVYFIRRHILCYLIFKSAFSLYLRL